jgi:hypothetical protein
MRRYLAILILVALMMATRGCLAKFGTTIPLRGRTKPAFTSGVELQIPFAYPDNKLGGMLAYSYTEFRSPVEHAAGLSRGTLNHANLGMEIRLLFGLPQWRRLYLEKVVDDDGQEIQSEIHEDIWSPG